MFWLKEFKKNFINNLLLVLLFLAIIWLRYDIPFFILCIFIPLFHFSEINKRFLSFFSWGLIGGIIFGFGECYFLMDFSFKLYLLNALVISPIYFLILFLFLFLFKKIIWQKINLGYLMVFNVVDYIWEKTDLPIALFSFIDGLAYFPFFLQLMSWGGENLVLFIFVFINYILYLLIFPFQNQFFLGKKEKLGQKKKLLFLLGLLGFIFLLGNFLSLEYFIKKTQTISSTNLRVILVQTNFSDQEIIIKNKDYNKQTIMKKDFSKIQNQNQFLINQMIKMTKTAFKEKTDLIVWPEISYQNAHFKEGANGNLIMFPNEGIEEVIKLVNEIKTPVLMSALVETFQGKNRLYNAAVLVEPNREIKQFYLKSKLFVFGEKLPFWLSWSSSLRKEFGWNSEFVSPKDSNLKNRIFHYNNFNFGVLICYENSFSKIANQLSQKNIDFMVNLSNDVIRDRRELNFQESKSVFRAIENRLPVLRATNFGKTEVINSIGLIEKEIAPFKEGYLYSDISINKKREKEDR